MFVMICLICLRSFPETVVFVFYNVIIKLSSGRNAARVRRRTKESEGYIQWKNYVLESLAPAELPTVVPVSYTHLSGKTESRRPDERTSGERSGTGQDGRHNGMDQTHEPDQSTGRGTGDPGDYLQLSLFPTQEEQLGEIRKAAAALEQPAAFLISDEVVDDILRTGSGQKNTLFHITARLIEGLDNEEMRSFLKDEYGTGGKGFTIDGQKRCV